MHFAAATNYKGNCIHLCPSWTKLETPNRVILSDEEKDLMESEMMKIKSQDLKGKKVVEEHLTDSVVDSLVVGEQEKSDRLPVVSEAVVSEAVSVENYLLLQTLSQSPACTTHPALNEKPNTSFCVNCRKYLCSQCLSCNFHDNHDILRLYQHKKETMLPQSFIPERVLRALLSVQTYSMKIGLAFHLAKWPGRARGNPSTYDGAHCICDRKLSSTDKKFCSIKCMLDSFDSEAIAAEAAAAIASAAEAAAAIPSATAAAKHRWWQHQD